MKKEIANDAKTKFDNVYVSPTPHAYIASMAQFGYEIGEQARPYCISAAELLRDLNRAAWPVQMLDVGCSYGIGSAFVKFGCSFREMVAFFATRCPKEYWKACEATRAWLNVTSPTCDVRAVGLDSSEPAVNFAVDAGLLDGGIARNLESEDVELTEDEKAWFRSCNLLISTGAVGYITEKTLGRVLTHLGKDSPCEYGPFAVVTILRMFDSAPIQACFEQHGLKFGRVEGIRLPQREFTDVKERESVLSLLNDRGLDTQEWEDTGKHYAELYVAGPAGQFELMEKSMLATAKKPFIWSL